MNSKAQTVVLTVSLTFPRGDKTIIEIVSFFLIYRKYLQLYLLASNNE